METMEFGHQLPLWTALAFVLMLLAIAVMPLAFPKFWHPNRNKLILSLLLSLPVIVGLAVLQPAPLYHTGKEFVSFVVLLASLYVISGGIVAKVNLRATPLCNTGFLALGAVLASLMGTTGAAMLLIRPLLDTNKERTRVVHTIIFFIFIVANIGGCLTPIGDPPLFMGYLAGVPFTWTLQLFPEWALEVGVLLLIYFVIDSIQFNKEPLAAREADRQNIQPLKVSGLQNLPLLIGVVLCVALLNDQVAPFPTRDLILVALAVCSWFFTKQELRQANQFTFYPIVEVAVLFFGIFATMIPPMLILQARGSELGVQSPMSFFWASGALSSFLDNTPTYVVFFSLAKGLGVPPGGVEVAHTGVEVLILKAISIGSVFMGANTYIGNAPNFMVKAIAEERKIKMPGFFGYMGYSLAILIPTFVLITLVFF